MYGISFVDSLVSGLETIKYRFSHVFLTFFIDVAMKLLLLIPVYDMLKETGLNSVDSYLAFLFCIAKSYIIFIALIVQIISWLLRAHLITISKSFIEDTGRPDIKFTLKRFAYFIGTVIGFYLIILGILFISYMFYAAYYDLIGLVILIAGAIFVVGYYRFVPYYSFIKGKLQGAFSGTKRVITGYFMESVKILALFFVLDVIIGSIQKSAPTFAVFLAFHAVRTAIEYIAAMVDISFISAAINDDVVEKMDIAESSTVY